MADTLVLTGTNKKRNGDTDNSSFPQAPVFDPVQLPGLDLGFADVEAERAAAGPLSLLGRGVRQAITQAGSEFGDDPLAHRFAVQSALRGFQDALGPTLEAARNVGLDRAQTEQAIQAQQEQINAQREFQTEMAQFNADLQKVFFDMQADLERELADINNQARQDLLDTQLDADKPEGPGSVQDFSALPGIQPVNPVTGFDTSVFANA